MDGDCWVMSTSHSPDAALTAPCLGGRGEYGRG